MIRGGYTFSGCELHVCCLGTEWAWLLSSYTVGLEVDPRSDLAFPFVYKYMEETIWPSHCVTSIARQWYAGEVEAGVAVVPGIHWISKRRWTYNRNNCSEWHLWVGHLRQPVSLIGVGPGHTLVSARLWACLVAYPLLNAEINNMVCWRFVIVPYTLCCLLLVSERITTLIPL